MANTVLEFPIRPYFGGSATADGAVTPIAVVPTTLFLQRTDSGSQVAPAGAGYALTNTAGWLYKATASEALVGLYYWYAEDADSQVIADGYIVITADDVGPYRAGSVVDQINDDETQQTLQSDAAAAKVAAQAAKAKTDLIGLSGSTLLTQSNTTVYSFIGETKSVTLATDDYSGKTLRIAWELPFSESDVEDIAVVENADITATSSSISFSIPSAVASARRKLAYSIRDVDNGDEVLLYGYWIVQSAALKDV